MELLETGAQDGTRRESKHVDLKQEPGRYRNGELLPGHPKNEAAALDLASEAACMANTDHGGALIIGVSDDGTPIGTQLDLEWLRLRIYELTQRQLTVSIREVTLHDVRILILKSPEAVEPIAVKHKMTWRVDDRCVEVDPSTWRTRRYARVDWSAQTSGLPISAVRDVAVGRARDYLREAGGVMADELAELPTADLLQRLNVTTPDGELTQAGAIAFVGRIDAPALDYIRRDYPGGGSRERIRLVNRGLIEELFEAERATSAFNPTTQIRHSLTVGHIRELPEPAVREVIVNACAHRDWNNPEASVIEHIGSTLTVTSPGGFPEGVTSANVLTHPSTSRNRSLVDLLARLRIAERQGIGIDLITTELLRLGHVRPEIEELPLAVQVTLVGGPPKQEWIRWLNQIQPRKLNHNVNALLLLDHLRRYWWVDAEAAAPVLQTNAVRAQRAISELAAATWTEKPVLELISGTPPGSQPAYRLNPAARSLIGGAKTTDRAEIGLHWARARGRISSTELASILGARPTNMRSVLEKLVTEGLITPGREGHRGAGFFYRPTEKPGAH